MLKYILKDEFCIGVRFQPCRDGFKPRKDDFERMYFQIDRTIFFVWNKEFEYALLMHKLTQKQ